jgi:DNA-binding CsgD family transcriptional regulator
MAHEGFGDPHRDEDDAPGYTGRPGVMIAGSRCAPHDPLGYRQLQVLARLAQGETNAEIGAALQISVETVKTHVRQLLVRLDATTRAHAVAIGFRRGLIT